MKKKSLVILAVLLGFLIGILGTTVFFLFRNKDNSDSVREEAERSTEWTEEQIEGYLVRNAILSVQNTCESLTEERVEMYTGSGDVKEIALSYVVGKDDEVQKVTILRGKADEADSFNDIFYEQATTLNSYGSTYIAAGSVISSVGTMSNGYGIACPKGYEGFAIVMLEYDSCIWSVSYSENENHIVIPYLRIAVKENLEQLDDYTFLDKKEFYKDEITCLLAEKEASFVKTEREKENLQKLGEDAMGYLSELFERADEFGVSDEMKESIALFQQDSEILNYEQFQNLSSKGKQMLEEIGKEKYSTLCNYFIAQQGMDCLAVSSQFGRYKIIPKPDNYSGDGIIIYYLSDQRLIMLSQSSDENGYVKQMYYPVIAYDEESLEEFQNTYFK